MPEREHGRMWRRRPGLSFANIYLRRGNVSYAGPHFHQALDQPLVFLGMSVGATWGGEKKKKSAHSLFPALSFLTVMSTKNNWTTELSGKGHTSLCVRELFYRTNFNL